MKRRPFLHLGLAALLAQPVIIHAQAARPDPRRPFRVGVDRSLTDSGLARHLNQALARDTGVGMQVEPGASALLLTQLDKGEIDATITNTPELDGGMAAAGLGHDRRFLAGTDFVIVGPVVQGRDPAGLRDPRRPQAAATDAGLALQAIAGTAALGKIRFVVPDEHSGAHVCEQGLWRALGVEPARDFKSDWYVQAGSSGALARAGDIGAYTLVDRIGFQRLRPKGLAVLAAGDPRLDCPYHMMLAFRVRHPAGRLVMEWLTGRQGRRALASYSVGGLRYRAEPRG